MCYINFMNNQYINQIEKQEITDNDKIVVYEAVLHRIQLLREVAMNGILLSELFDAICLWSYSHRVGEYSDSEQQELIDHQFLKLKKLVGY